MRVRVPIRKADQASRLGGIQTINVDTVVPLPDPLPDGLAGPDASASSGCGHASGQPVHAHEGHGCGAVRQRPPDLGRPRHDDRHPRHRSRPRQPGRQRHEHGPAQDRRLGHLHGSVYGRRPDVAAVGRHRERRRRRVHRVRHCVHRCSRGRHVQVRSHAGGPARRGERVRHRLRRRPQPKRRLRRLLRHPLAGLEQQRPGRLRQRPQLRRRVVDDRLQGQPRHRPLRARQPGDAGERVRPVRRPDRSSGARVRWHRHRLGRPRHPRDRDHVPATASSAAR